MDILNKELQKVHELKENENSKHELEKHFKNIIDAEINIEKVKAKYEKKIEKLNEQMEDELEIYIETKNKAEDKLEKYYKDQLKVNPDFKVKNKYGQITKRKQQPKFKRDNRKFIKWLEKNNYNKFIKTEKKPEWGKFKKGIVVKGNQVITENGEIVEGVVAEDRPDKIVIKTNKGG